MKSAAGCELHNPVAYECDAAGNRVVWVDVRCARASWDDLMVLLAAADIHGWEQLAILEVRDGALWAELRNPDGTREEFCGNAFRCVSVIPNLGPDAAIHTAAGRFQSLPGGGIRIMESAIKVTVDSADLLIDVGTPHRVRFVTEWTDVDVIGLEWSTGTSPVNATFVEVLSTSILQCRTFERGVGETASCGSGALSAVVALTTISKSQAPSATEVRFRSGEVLHVHRSSTREAWEIRGRYHLVRSAELKQFGRLQHLSR